LDETVVFTQVRYRLTDPAIKGRTVSKNVSKTSADSGGCSRRIAELQVTTISEDVGGNALSHFAQSFG
jgi:hypothetical protein